MIKRTPNRDICLVSGSDVGSDKDWMPLGMFQLSTEDGALLQKTAGGIVYRYISETVDLGGSFNAGSEVKCVRVGDVVTIASVGTLSHSSSSSVGSSSGDIPEIYRPPSSATNVYLMSGSGFGVVDVQTSGSLITTYRDWTGSATNRISTGSAFSITYTV